MSREKISNVDLALLRMDDPKNLMIITSLMIFDTPLDIEDLKHTIQRAFLCYPRFRQRIVEPLLPFRKPQWQDDPQFDLDEHIERIELTLPAEQSLLEHLIGQLMSLPLNPERPLWKFYLVENYGEGSALIGRLHHSIADGIELTRVLLSMTDTQADGQEGAQVEKSPCDGKRSLGRRKKRISLLRSMQKYGQIAVENPIEAAHNLRKGAHTVVAMGRFVTRWPDPKTVFKGKLGEKKLAVWSKPISLAAVKEIGRAYNATVNDVLLTVVAGSLRKYLLDHDQLVKNRDLHSFIPVNLRPESLYGELGNQFGLVFLSLPVNIEDPIQRLQKLKENMDELKTSPEAIATLGLFHLLGAAPNLQKVALSIFDSKGTAVTTNVPGPQQQLYLADAPINTLMAWVPKSGHVGLGISILSYNGKVLIGVTTDAGLVPDPDKILDFFLDEFETLKAKSKAKKATNRAGLTPALNKLNEALDSLDTILSKDEKSWNGHPKTDDNKTEEKTATILCQATTKSGKPCKNKALPGEEFCRVHSK